MSFSILQDYLDRLPRSATPGQRIWSDENGQAHGQYFSCTLTSVFQPVRQVDTNEVVAYEAFIRSYSKADSGLSIWKLLEFAASDDESVELDRLCRMLHVVNFFRQIESSRTDLYLTVHDRLLAAVSSSHGTVFRRILDGLGLSTQRIVLQLPEATPNQRWLLDHVAGSYRQNRFRVAVNVADAASGLRLLQQMRPDAIKLDAREIADPAAVENLLHRCRALNIDLLFKRVESEMVVDNLTGLSTVEHPILAQGYAWDQPKSSLDVTADGARRLTHQSPAAVGAGPELEAG